MRTLEGISELQPAVCTLERGPRPEIFHSI